MAQKKLFTLVSQFEPGGDQPQAILALTQGLKKGKATQTLLGATGTGKTFTMAHTIAQHNKPTLVIAHNKTLAAQLAQEFRSFFPDAAVHYFVSYYDYYQPEAYLPVTDTYIEKDAQINKEIDRLRHASTQSLLTRQDVIIVASVSCIYGLGSPEEYREEHIHCKVGDRVSRNTILERLVKIQFTRTNADLESGTFRALGGTIEIMPVSETYVLSVEIDGGSITRIQKVDPVTSIILSEEHEVFVFPAKHFLTNGPKKEKALVAIEKELETQLKVLQEAGRNLEGERLKRRTKYDLAMIREVGYCSGIENYSRHLSDKQAGEPPETLLSYFPHTKNGAPDFLTVIDESHVTLPQIRAMYRGDQARKETLVEFGFRLPSAKDNRPLRYEEFQERIGQVVYVSATPGEYERTESEAIIEQIIRPTGLLDPELFVVPVKAQGQHKGQVQHAITTAEQVIKGGGRVLMTTLTKKMAEDLSLYLKERSLKAEYLHSDITTLDRIKILTEFRKGVFDCLVGVNLLREGLDLPEVECICILDADKEGFLRSETSLIQTIGRAARNVHGRVFLYADILTGSLDRAIQETNRRRSVQMAFNQTHGITPRSVSKEIKDITSLMESEHQKTVRTELATDIQVFVAGEKNLKKRITQIKKLIKQKRLTMVSAVKELDFETAALVRDQILELEALVAKGGVLE